MSSTQSSDTTPPGHLYQGCAITPDSYENSDMPGYLFPRAQVSHPSQGTHEVVLPPIRGASRIQADRMAIAEAKRRITDNSL